LKNQLVLEDETENHLEKISNLESEILEKDNKID